LMRSGLAAGMEITIFDPGSVRNDRSPSCRNAGDRADS
jgi:hypothetical protein